MPDPFPEELTHESVIGSDDTFNSDNIFPGSSLTVLGALAILFTWFSSFPGISKQALGQLFHILHHFILPSGNLFPATYAQAFSVIQSLLVPVKEYHCCPNDCIIYRGPHSDKTHCPVCGEPRFLEGQVPKKRFKYIPLAPRIQRFFQNAHTSQLLQSHSLIPATSNVCDIQQTQTWKKWYSQHGIFSGDARGLALALCLDGTNPYSQEKNAYSMWPMLVSFLNLPPALRRVAGFLQLVGIIPGKNEPKNTDPYLKVLIDELQELHGMRIYDAHQKNMFELKVSVLLHILDYPGQNKVFHCHGE